MKRVVVTGLGIISSIGNNTREVKESLKTGKSGIEYCQEYSELGLRSQIYAPVRIDPVALIDKKINRLMGYSAAYTYLAMKEAIDDSRLDPEKISNPGTGIICGSGIGSSRDLIESADILLTKGIRRVKPTIVPKIMASTTSANLAVAYNIQGVNYSISSACATSAHCIGNAYEIIQAGKQNIIFAGGGEDIHWANTFGFDSMGALSSSYNDSPEKASRPYDKDRDGFVVSGGGGMLVIEELEHALKRQAPVYAEIIGYGATSDGNDMVKPSGEGAVRCMRQAMANIDAPIDYINAHGTSTPAGDITELNAIKQVFGQAVPKISSTKSISGHGLGAAGANEAIYSLLMMENDFISPSVNIYNLDEAAAGMPIVTETQNQAGLHVVMSNSFGFGGTNVSLVFKKPTGI